MINNNLDTTISGSTPSKSAVPGLYAKNNSPVFRSSLWDSAKGVPALFSLFSDTGKFKTLFSMAVMAAMLPVLVLTWSASPAAAADAAAEKAEASAVKVIVNSDVADESLKSDFIMNVFLGKITKWPEGKKIIPVVLGKGDTAREFLRNYVKKTPQQFSTFWKKQVFTGKGTPPKEFDTDSELIEFVQKTSGAVGFVAASTEPENVKVVKID